jgi:fermentation-respiration switch protein FrsA (DUF1100 family)
MYVTLFLIQRYLIFPAYMANVTLGYLKTPAEYSLPGFREVPLETVDHVHIVSWLHDPAPGKPIILYMPGNAMHIAARIPRYRAFAEAGFGVMALSWRGYGRSEGSPSEEGLYRDARAAIALLGKTYPASGIILYGESLGTGVAVQMATEYPVYGVVLQSAYTSIEDRVADIYWFLPGIHYLVRDRFDSLSKVSRIHAPVLIIHGDRDDVVPFSDGKKLARNVTAPLCFVTAHGAGHVNIPDALIARAVTSFFTAGRTCPAP